MNPEYSPGSADVEGRIGSKVFLALFYINFLGCLWHCALSGLKAFVFKRSL